MDGMQRSYASVVSESFYGALREQEKRRMETTVVYSFPNGFAEQARHMYGWLRHYNLNPSWDHGTDERGWRTDLIRLPAHEVSCLRMMQRSNPARFGNPPSEES